MRVSRLEQDAREANERCSELQDLFTSVSEEKLCPARIAVGVTLGCRLLNGHNGPHVGFLSGVTPDAVVIWSE